VAVQKNNLRRLLRTVEALSDLGPEMTAERDFPQTARAMVSALLQAGGAREGVLFTFSDKPSMLSSVASEGFALMPEPAIMPLLPKHVHALTTAHGPVVLKPGSYDVFLSSNGNVAPELFKCVAPLKVGGKLVGMVALGRREGDALFDDEDLGALELLCNYVAVAMQNHVLSQTLAQRVSEIVIEFKPIPHSIFSESAGPVQANQLVIRLQPDEGVKQFIMIKDPGPGGMRLRMAPLDIRFADAFKVRYPDAYERLLMDVVRGNATLFMRRDEVEAAWRWVEPIIEAWGQTVEPPKPYLAGSWGPTAAIALIERDGRTWFEDGH